MFRMATYGSQFLLALYRKSLAQFLFWNLVIKSTITSLLWLYSLPIWNLECSITLPILDNLSTEYSELTTEQFPRWHYPCPDWPKPRSAGFGQWALHVRPKDRGNSLTAQLLSSAHPSTTCRYRSTGVYGFPFQSVINLRFLWPEWRRWWIPSWQNRSPRFRFLLPRCDHGWLVQKTPSRSR